MQVLDDIDFAGMDKQECVAFLERFTQQRCVNLYYCMPDLEIPEGLRLITSDLSYADFIFLAYECGVELRMYVDHLGTNIQHLLNEDKGELTSADDQLSAAPSGSVDLNLGIDLEDLDLNSNREDDHFSQEMHVDPDLEEITSLPQRVITDPFLTKLCRKSDVCPGTHDANVPNDNGEIEGNDEDEMDENDPHPEIHPSYNEDVHWKKQKPILGMRFESPSKMKNMLCNYAVANGYQLCYVKNDSKRLLVNCCSGECPFRLWGTWMSDEHSFQIKSLKGEHNCARNFKLGSIVNYRWVGAHFTSEVVQNQKLTVRMLKEEVKRRFGIEVSMGQCRRAKQHAISIVQGSIVEHYAKLWSYGEEIIRSNPGSTVNIGVNAMPDGTSYFSRMYICFAGIKNGCDCFDLLFKI